MIAYVECATNHFAPILHLSGTFVILNCYMSFQNDQACACICTNVWGPFLTFVVTVVNMRNVFYYELSEYAQLTLYNWCGQLQ